MLYEFGDFNLKDKFEPVWARQERSGFALGSAGAFLVIESRAHAEARGAKPYARLTNVVADLSQRKQPGDVNDDAWKAVVETRPTRDDSGAIITGATGAEPVTSEEQAFLAEHPGFRGARDRHHVRPYHGNPVSAGTGAGRAFDLARRTVSAERSLRGRG